jgi:ABC-type sugar transport system substrate-binding protein
MQNPSKTIGFLSDSPGRRIALLVVISITSLVGPIARANRCQPPVKQISNHKIVMLVDKEDLFWRNYLRLMQRAAAKYQLNIMPVNARENHVEMISMVEKIVTSPKSRPAAIIFKSYKRNGLEILKVAEKAKVRTLNVNSPVEFNLDKSLTPDSLQCWLGQILPDDIHAGKILAETLLLHASRHEDGKYHMIAINGDVGDKPADLRRQGLFKVINTRDDVILHQLVYDGWTAPAAKAKFIALKKRFPSANIVWAGNDVIGLKVLEGAKKMDLKPGEDIFIGGIDATPDGLEAVKQGYLVTTVGGHVLEGVISILYLNRIFQSLEHSAAHYPISIKTGMTAITRETAAQALEILSANSASTNFNRLNSALPKRKGFVEPLSLLLPTKP